MLSYVAIVLQPAPLRSRSLLYNPFVDQIRLLIRYIEPGLAKGFLSLTPEFDNKHNPDLACCFSG